jgi:cyclin A
MDTTDFDFYKYLLNKEAPIDPNYLNKQSISDEMRATVIDWIISLGDNYKVDNSVIHFTIALLDKFLSSHVIKTRSLQVAGAACFLIACKHNEQHPPKVAELVYSIDGTASKSDILDMEVLVLKNCGFYIRLPTSYNFLCDLVNNLPKDFGHNSFNFSSYYIELSLLTTASLQFSYSLIAASSLLLARIILQIDDPWPMITVMKTDLDIMDMYDCILFVSSLVSAAHEYPPTENVRRKYEHYKYNSVSKLRHPECFMLTR